MENELISKLTLGLIIGVVFLAFLFISLIVIG